MHLCAPIIHVYIYTIHTPLNTLYTPYIHHTTVGTWLASISRHRSGGISSTWVDSPLSTSFAPSTCRARHPWKRYINQLTPLNNLLTRVVQGIPGRGTIHVYDHGIGYTNYVKEVRKAYERSMIALLEFDDARVLHLKFSLFLSRKVLL